MNIINRIFELLKTEDSIIAFTKKTTISSSKIALWRKKPTTSPQFEVIEDILRGYPNINLKWLILGQGLMFQNEDNNNYQKIRIISKVNEEKTLYKKEEKLKCVLTGSDCSFREMDGLRQEVERLRKENEKLSKEK